MTTTTEPAMLDRRRLLAANEDYNGIDFVDVAGPTGTALAVHFLNAVPVVGSLGSPPATITGGEVIASVPVLAIDEATAWSADSQGRPILALTVAASGDASTYTLTLTSTKLDPFFSTVPVVFPTTTAAAGDPASPAPSRPVPASDSAPIDYLAKDFASFRQALSEFSLLRYQNWVERSEADLGMVLMEVLAAMADELSYHQDRVRGESALATASQRLSAIRHARLVDYEPAPATVATTVLALEVAAAENGNTGWTLDTPLRVRALGAEGSIVEFEVEDPALGLAGAPAGQTLPWMTVDTRWNRRTLSPYYWDDSQRCLAAGATELYLVGSNLGLYTGQQLLLDTATATADPPVRELVTVAATLAIADPLQDVPLTQITLASPTIADHDLRVTAVAGNIVPAVQGSRFSEQFMIPAAGAASPAPVIVRFAVGSTPTAPLPEYRYCLTAGPLAWLATGADEEYSATTVAPEIALTQLSGLTSPSPAWTFARWLLDAGPSDQVFTLTPEQYSPVLTAGGVTWMDYDGDGGTTIRFGAGTFGVSPNPGAAFEVLYRIGGGSSGNVPADTVVGVAPDQTQAGLVMTCTNPFAATGGQDAETIAQVRARAPQRFSAEPLRLVLAGDYAMAAESLDWVQQAGTSFRWTGSWLTAVTTADPVGVEVPSTGQLASLTQLLDARRLAGTESYVQGPSYTSLDLSITVAGLATAFASDVEEAVVAALAPGQSATGDAGFFNHSRWGFGQPLEESALLAAIQSATGVVGVSSLAYRPAASGAPWIALVGSVAVAAHRILRVDNDPSRPQAGTLAISVEGSK
jgi:Baseplate J-like protein